MKKKQFTALLLAVFMMMTLCVPTLAQDSICRTVQEFVSAVQYYTGMGMTSFQVSCDSSTYNALSADNGTAFHLAIQKGGIADFGGCSITGYGDVYTYSFSSVSFSVCYTCRTLDEFQATLSALAENQITDFTVQCDRNLFGRLMADNCALLNGIEMYCGIYMSNMSYSNDTCSFIYRGCDYYPGFRVYQMAAAGRENELYGQEKELLDFAKRVISEKIYGKTLLEKEMRIHDYLCDRVTYYLHDSDSYDIYDTAIGALLYGYADCDGYADAFYLLCSLAGIPVKMVSGYVSDSSVFGSQGNGEGPHAWNLVSLDGGSSWYLVDVTNDNASKDHKLHFRFNVGKRTVSSSYTWEEDAVPVYWAPDENSALNYSSGLFFGAPFTSLSDAARYAAENMWNGSVETEVRIDGVYSSNEIMNALLSSLRDVWGNHGWEYGCKAWTVIGNYTYAVLYAIMR